VASLLLLGKGNHTTGDGEDRSLKWLKLLVAILVVSSVFVRIARSQLVPALPFDPVAYDGQQMQLVGEITRLKSTISQRGNPYYHFVLTSVQGGVVVFKFGSTSCLEGQRATVKGVFHHVYQRGGSTFVDEVDAESVRCD
jgi:hypothetical protein